MSYPWRLRNVETIKKFINKNSYFNISSASNKGSCYSDRVNNLRSRSPMNYSRMSKSKEADSKTGFIKIATNKGVAINNFIENNIKKVNIINNPEKDREDCNFMNPKRKNLSFNSIQNELNVSKGKSTTGSLKRSYKIPKNGQDTNIKNIIETPPLSDDNSLNTSKKYFYSPNMVSVKSTSSLLKNTLIKNKEIIEVQNLIKNNNNDTRFLKKTSNNMLNNRNLRYLNIDSLKNSFNNSNNNTNNNNNTQTSKKSIPQNEVKNKDSGNSNVNIIRMMSKEIPGENYMNLIPHSDNNTFNEQQVDRIGREKQKQSTFVQSEALNKIGLNKSNYEEETMIINNNLSLKKKMYLALSKGAGQRYDNLRKGPIVNKK